MKAVDFPAATPVAASSCETFPCSSSQGTDTDVFAQVMEQALGDASAESSDSSDSGSETPSGADAPSRVAVEPDSAAASHWLAALIVPLVTPTMAKASGAVSGSSDVMTLPTMSGEASAHCDLPTPTSIQAPIDASAPAMPLGTSAELVNNNGDAKAPASALAQRGNETNVSSSRALETLKPFGGADLKLDSAIKSAPPIPLATGATVNSPAANPLNGIPVTPNSPAETSAEATAEATEAAGQYVPSDVTMDAPATPRSGRAEKTPAKADEIMGSGRAEASGTSGAKYVQPTKTAENMNEFTGSSEQNLPGAATLDAPSPGKTFRTASAAPALKTEAVGAASIDAPANNHRAEEATTTTVTATGPISTRSLDRAEDLMALHGFRLRDSGLESMRVVIKPDPNLHLALNVQMRDNAVEITAQLQRGDHDLLSRHWPELQQQLEQRGIRLAPLAQSEPNTNSNHSNNNSSFSQHSNRHQNEDRQTRSGAFAEFALESVLVPKRAAKATIPRGWESWA